MTSINTSGFNSEEFRSRLRAVTDAELIRYSKAGKFLTDPKQNRVSPPLGGVRYPA